MRYSLIANGLDVRWKRQQIQSVMMQAILLDDSIPEIAHKLAMTVGVDLINQDMTKRYGWLYNKFTEEELTEELEKAFDKLSGGDLLL